jgi:flagellar motor switch protein FliG
MKTRIKGGNGMASAQMELQGRVKAAIFMISLGSENAARIFRYLKEDEIEQITLEIANLQKVDSKIKESVVEEFYQICLAQNYISEGGIEYARDILERALGSQKALDLISRLTSALQVRPFDFIRKVDPAHLFSFIQHEHPQTIALILSYLDPSQASATLSALPPEKQAEVAIRIASMDRAAPEYIKEVERVLEKKMALLSVSDYTETGGIQAIVDILNSVDRSTEKNILENLEKRDKLLAEEIKKRMFVFEDITKLDNRFIQRILSEVDVSDLMLAIRGTTDEVSRVIYANMSKRLQETIKEDMEYMGPVRLRDVEEAQQKIVGIVRRLEEAGEIVISRGKGDEILV